LTDDGQNQLPPERPVFVSPPPIGLRRVPVQGSVDRRAALSPTLIDTKLIRKDGTWDATLRFPLFGNYGMSPSDPGWWSERLTPRLAFCRTVARCGAASSLLAVLG